MSVLIKNLAGLEPTVVGYALSTDAIQKFVETNLAEEGLDGLQGVRVIVPRDGENSPPKIFAFILRTSKDINVAKGIDSPLAYRMDSGAAKPSETLRRSLGKFTRSTELQVKKIEGGSFAVELSVVDVLNLMFSVDPRSQEIFIHYIENESNDKARIHLFKQFKNTRDNKAVDDLIQKAKKLMYR